MEKIARLWRSSFPKCRALPSILFKKMYYVIDFTYDNIAILHRKSVLGTVMSRLSGAGRAGAPSMDPIPSCA